MQSARGSTSGPRYIPARRPDAGSPSSPRGRALHSLSDNSSGSIDRDPARWQLPLVLLVSLAYESLFVHHGVNAMDEGWPLYAVARLLDGGTLYRDVLWVFPPASLLPAWLGHMLDPPGFLVARYVYASMAVALSGTIYLLARRLLPASYALLAALLVAVAAPHSHLVGVVFGYRYLVFTVLALLAFAEHLRAGGGRWLVLAGVSTGVGLLFRLTPAFAVSVGIGVGLLVASERWEERIGGALRFGAGLAIPVLPVLAYFAMTVGLDVLWQQVVIRPVEMTRLQSLPVPIPSLPIPPGRQDVESFYAAAEFWLYPALYLGYAAWLARRWSAARAKGEPFEDVLLLSVVVWGGVFLMRSFGRSDVFHLESAVPPVCLLLAHGTHRLVARVKVRRPRTDALAIAVALLAWTGLKGVDLYASPARLGTLPVESLDGKVRTTPVFRLLVDQPVAAIRRHTAPGDVILDLSASPLLYVASERRGPGGDDIVMPGTFRSVEDERAMVARLDQAPPRAVLVPRLYFDGREDRAPWAVAPELYAWVQLNYVLAEELEFYYLLVPRPRG